MFNNYRINSAVKACYLSKYFNKCLNLFNCFHTNNSNSVAQITHCNYIFNGYMLGFYFGTHVCIIKNARYVAFLLE